MEILTAEQIAKLVTDDFPDETNFRKLQLKVDKLFLRQDDSNLWPILGKFNVTKRAISRLRKAEREGLEFDSLLSYALTLEHQTSSIVNDPKNW